MGLMENHNPVREIRTALKLSQEDMAQRLGCSISSERRFEYTGTIPRNKAVLVNLHRLAKQAGVQLHAQMSRSQRREEGLQ
jgi:DNA-binding transcriptional regulator YiaG